MPLDPSAVGFESSPSETSWTAKDSLLYALGVGAGTADLAYTTENSIGVEHRALPTMPVVVCNFGREIWEAMGSFSWDMLVHGSQEIILHQPMPTEGRALTTHRLTGMWDKGKAAVVDVETTAADLESGAPMFTLRGSLFIRGEGGWGGDRGPSVANPIPDRDPDSEVRDSVGLNQALVYRLSGDRNPLHSDPAFAAKAGFDRPILHGLCTYGITGRALLGSLCGGDPERFGGMAGRFASPVFPGDDLVVKVWETDGGGAFQTLRADGTVVFDAGSFTSR